MTRERANSTQSASASDQAPLVTWLRSFRAKCVLAFLLTSTLCAPGVLISSLRIIDSAPVHADNSKTDATQLERKLPAMDKFTAELEKLLTRYYPKIQRTQVSSEPEVIQFEYNTMKFMIHHPLKTGEWQPARETIGPQRRGVICGIRLNPGRWAGAAMVPQVFDHKYYNTLLMAPYSEANDCHLVANLSYPEYDVDGNFLREYQRLVNDFAKYLH